ncbi:MAG: UDP-N-acetylmuramate dehydrogenase [Candidatus Paceibacterota bacterium]
MDSLFEELKKALPGIKENVELKDYSTFRIGGPAKYFFKAENEIELKIAAQKALDLKINFKILGGGSNTLISSQGFGGLAIIFKNKPRVEDFLPVQINNEYFVEAPADWPLFFLVEQAAISGLSGMEWAIGIPGTIGGAVNGNAGAFGVSIGDSIDGVQVLEIKNNFISERFFTSEDCGFGYRSSVFKNNPDLIILSARIKLMRGDAEKIKEQIENNISKRKDKQPKGFSIGSIFKNFKGEVPADALNSHAELKEFLIKGAIPAGYLIEQCGLKGQSIGGARVSEEHANFIINTGDATSEDVLSLIALVKNQVEAKFQIVLQEEIKIF